MLLNSTALQVIQWHYEETYVTALTTVLGIIANAVTVSAKMLVKAMEVKYILFTMFDV